MMNHEIKKHDSERLMLDLSPSAYYLAAMPFLNGSSNKPRRTWDKVAKNFSTKRDSCFHPSGAPDASSAI